MGAKPFASEASILSSSWRSFMCEPLLHSMKERVGHQRDRSTPLTQIEIVDGWTFGEWSVLVEVIDDLFLHLCYRITTENFNGHRRWSEKSSVLFDLHDIDNLNDERWS